MKLLTALIFTVFALSPAFAADQMDVGLGSWPLPRLNLNNRPVIN
jgi:hypothetical protein